MIPNFRELLELMKKGATLEAQEKIVELHEAHLELRESNLKLQEEIGELKRQLAIATDLIWEDPYYFMVRDGQRNGPFCQACNDSSDKLVHLQRLNDNSNCRFRCTVCSTAYECRTPSQRHATSTESWRL